MYPIVDIICSSPTMNTCSRKWNVPKLDPAQLSNGDGVLDIHYFFTLLNTMENHKIVQVIQSDSTAYDLQDIDKEDIADWKRIKKKNARVRHMRKIRRRVKLLVKLWVFFWNKNWTHLYCSVLHNFATANDVYRCQNWDDPSHDTIKVKMWCNNTKNGMNITCLYHMIPQ